jgi:hypothetical protein
MGGNTFLLSVFLFILKDLQIVFMYVQVDVGMTEGMGKYVWLFYDPRLNEILGKKSLQTLTDTLRVDGWVGGWVGGQVDGWMDGCNGGWVVDGWMDR